MKDEPVVDREQVAAWLAQLEAQLEQIDSETRALANTRTELQRQIELLKELLGEAVPAPVREARGTTRFGETLSEVLKERSAPMHLVEIRSALSVRGVEIPGQGTDANIIAYLRRLPGIRRVSRGTYSMDAGEPPSEAPKNLPHRRRKRRTRTRKRRSAMAQTEQHPQGGPGGGSAG